MVGNRQSWFMASSKYTNLVSGWFAMVENENKHRRQQPAAYGQRNQWVSNLLLIPHFVPYWPLVIIWVKKPPTNVKRCSCCCMLLGCETQLYPSQIHNLRGPIKIHGPPFGNGPHLPRFPAAFRPRSLEASSTPWFFSCEISLGVGTDQRSAFPGSQ